MVLDPLTFVERLAALVPRPRVHLVTYHGMFAPAAPLRDRVVPPPPDEEIAQTAQMAKPAPTSAPCAHPPPTVPPAATRKPTAHKRHRYSWAELRRRVFHVDVFLCECGGLRRLLAAIFAPEPIRRILLHLGLPADPPPVAPARNGWSGPNRSRSMATACSASAFAATSMPFCASTFVTFIDLVVGPWDARKPGTPQRAFR